MAALLVLAPAAQASHGPVKRLADGAERIAYRIGPINVTPGQNRIVFRPITGSERPAVNGWMTRLRPDLVWASGPRKGHAPRSDHVMFHHGVWVNVTRGDPILGTGEEKTLVNFPEGYGYRYEKTDTWLLNDMIHNLTAQPMKLYLQYTVDFIPDGSPAAEGITPVHPIGMNVAKGKIYPVFDVLKGSGGPDGKFTYPRDDPDAYPPGVHKNLVTLSHDGYLLSDVGHVHTGGLYTDLYLHRPGAKYAGPRCNSKPKAAQRQACWQKAPQVKGDRVHLFRSKAHYYEPAGPVSWDMAMTVPKPGWRVAVHAGDTLEMQATYETKRASWYESMGLMVVFMVYDDSGVGEDPYEAKVDYPGIPNHGHLAENDFHGGSATDLPDPRKLPSGAATGDPFLITNFSYGAGDYRVSGAAGDPPVVQQGQSLTFELGGPDAAKEEWHSLTSCAAPCNRSTGIAYPIPNGKWQFDSGQLGNLNGTGAPPTVGRTTWSTPNNLPAGTYTYFCRIHPTMRGAFRVVN